MERDGNSSSATRCTKPHAAATRRQGGGKAAIGRPQPWMAAGCTALKAQHIFSAHAKRCKERMGDWAGHENGRRMARKKATDRAKESNRQSEREQQTERKQAQEIGAKEGARSPLAQKRRATGRTRIGPAAQDTTHTLTRIVPAALLDGLLHQDCCGDPVWLV